MSVRNRITDIMQYALKYTSAGFPPTVRALGRGTGISPGEGDGGKQKEPQTTLPGIKTHKWAEICAPN